MTERVSVSSDAFLDGIDWSEAQRPKAEVCRIQHGSDGISFVDLSFEGRLYQIALYTDHLDLPEAELACQRITEWWDESKNTDIVYGLDGEILLHDQVV